MIHVWWCSCISTRPKMHNRTIKWLNLYLVSERDFTWFLGFQLTCKIVRTSSNQGHARPKGARSGALSPGSPPAPFPTPLIPYPFPYFLCLLNSFPLLICSFVSFWFKLTSVGHLLIPGTAWHVLYPLSQSFSPPRKKRINTLMARNVRQLRLNGLTLGHFSGKHESVL